MKLLDNWRDIARMAWSFRLAIASAVFSACEAALPYIREWAEPMGVLPPGLFALLASVAAIGAAFTRLYAQLKLTKGYGDDADPDDRHPT